jgi:hypothetical protein
MTRIRSISELTHAATRALVKELGYADAVRFLRVVGTGRGDYVKERRALLEGLDVDRVLEEAKARQSRAPKRRRARGA